MSLDDEHPPRDRRTWLVAAGYSIFVLLGVGILFFARNWQKTALGAGSAVVIAILAIRAARAGIFIDENGLAWKRVLVFFGILTDKPPWPRRLRKWRAARKELRD